MKLPRDVGTITAKKTGINRITTRARRILTRSHDTTRIKNCGTRIISIRATCITVTKDVTYFCPTGSDEGIFSAVTKLLSEKIKQVKQSGDANAKTINAIECESFCNFFKIPEPLYDAAFTQVIGESTPEILGMTWIDYLPDTTPVNT